MCVWGGGRLASDFNCCCVSFSISDTLKSLGGAWNTGMIRGKLVSVVMT